jgi:hypothetical protein
VLSKERGYLGFDLLHSSFIYNATNVKLSCNSYSGFVLTQKMNNLFAPLEFEQKDAKGASDNHGYAAISSGGYHRSQ